jgi:hypothetical protein
MHWHYSLQIPVFEVSVSKCQLATAGIEAGTSSIPPHYDKVIEATELFSLVSLFWKHLEVLCFHSFHCFGRIWKLTVFTLFTVLEESGSSLFSLFSLFWRIWKLTVFTLFTVLEESGSSALFSLFSLF